MAFNVGKFRNINTRLQHGFVCLERSMENTVSAMTKIVEVKDPYTAVHQQRVVNLSSAIGKEMNLPPEKIDGVCLAAMVHDLGKIYVPGEILSKPGQLSRSEFNMIKTHSQLSYEIVKELKFPWPIPQIILQHHERVDGSGYPQGLSDKDILLEARILAVADVVEAMSSYRPYRPALGIEKALEEISKNKGRLYDEKVVDSCLKLFAEEMFEFNE